ncbi:MAG: LuxR C-terminal-related transcriptional regulator [Clostridiales bacterium]|nr:LuxR C-terminal-related transcriptional regulator [Clostridiales bacterium]
MEKNDMMNLNNIIYRIYDADDFETMKKNLLHDIRMLIPCLYASILMANRKPGGTIFADPCCVPEEFLEAEKEYIRLEDVDHLLWTYHSSQPVVIQESRIVSEEKRLSSPIYQSCYGKYDVYDTLQLTIAHEQVFLGVLTLYRSMEEGVFSDEHAFFLEMICPHLSRIFYRHYETSAKKTEAQTPGVELFSLKQEYALTNREAEILSLLFGNVPDEEITGRLHISPHTLKKHIQNMYHKLGVSSRWELMRFRP